MSFEDMTGVLPTVDDPTGELASLSPDPTQGLVAGDVALVVRRGPDAGAVFVLIGQPGTVITCGRQEDSSMFLDDVTVSRRHAEFHSTDTGWVIKDCGSLNGTYVNKDRIDEVPLKQGDEVQIGKYRFAVHVAGDVAGDNA